MALSGYVRPIVYCEIDPYCQGVLLNRMADSFLHASPIWDDIRTLKSKFLPPEYIDILYGGFPCQDISIAGLGKGLEGERSGLFFEIVRLSKEIKPKFIFLENVPAITSRGGLRVVREIAEMGYDCKWCVISAASIGAPHKRERWFLLAHAKHFGSSSTQELGSAKEGVRDTSQRQDISEQSKRMDTSEPLASESSSNPSSMRCDERPSEGIQSERQTSKHEESSNSGSKILNYWEEVEPPVCGMDDGSANRVDKIRALGNAVVHQQAKEAFKILMGVKNGMEKN